MQPSPLVSLLIPLYNVASYCEQCLRSAMAQTYLNIEIIIVDDGSTDDSGQIADTIAKEDTRIKVFHKSNSGIADTRNYALKQAKGEYIAWVDSDDWVEKTFIENLINNALNKDTDVSLCGIRSFYEGSIRKKQIPRKFPQETLSASQALTLLIAERKMTNHLCNKLIKRHLYEGIVFPVGCYYEDIQVTMHLLAKAKKIAYTGTYEYHYRRHRSAICKQSSPKHLFDYGLAFAKQLEFIRSSECPLDAEVVKRLKIYPLKGIIRSYHKLSQCPESDEREKYMHQLSEIMSKLGVEPIIKGYGRKMLQMSLRKRRIEHWIDRVVLSGNEKSAILL